ncbi:MAG: SIR2 family protein [Erysipelotrichaceae bacterium]|jgi:hypothetical protein|nr:SIR2 family protein [Erysipelotrichaceae bacterium]
MEIKKFINEYSENIKNDKAAIFIGSGISVNSGFVSWKDLLRNVASDIGLNIEKETHDLISVAQYYQNKENRAALNKIIVNSFSKPKKFNKYFDIITKLPIKTIWTTNYDHEIEEYLKKNGHDSIDIKKTNRSVAVENNNSNTIIYKFHGDYEIADEAVITKDDFETFSGKRTAFEAILKSQLLSKTFVFIGYSFNDPNLLFLLSKMRIVYEQHIRDHYLIIREIKKNCYDTENDYQYDLIKQQLFLDDLKRYGIKAVLIKEYDDIYEIFSSIKNNLDSRKIFVAGSSRDYGEWTLEKARYFLFELGRRLVELGCQVGTGYIEGVGPELSNGILNCVSEKGLSISDYLIIKRLPLIGNSDEHISPVVREMYQHNMINDAGIILFLFGNNRYDGIIKPSKTVLEEFERSKKYGKYIIPVGATGYAASIILDAISKENSEFKYLVPHIGTLKDSENIKKLVDTVSEIILSIRNSSFEK